MGKIVIGLVGLLVAVVFAVAMMPVLVDNIDVLDDTVGPDGECRVIGNRYVALYTGDNDEARAQIALAATPQVGDARLGQTWRLGEYVADKEYAGVPQAVECTRDINTLLTPTVFVATLNDVVTEVAAEDYPPPVSGKAFALAAPVTGIPAVQISDYVAIAYVDGDERQYSGVMTALIRLIPVLLILAIFIFIIIRVGIDRIPGLGGSSGGRRRRR